MTGRQMKVELLLPEETYYYRVKGRGNKYIMK